LAAKVEQQRAYFESRLAGLHGHVSAKPAGVKRAARRAPRKAARAKPKPKYQSKKHKSLKWTGGGVPPTWMREEDEGHQAQEGRFPDQVVRRAEAARNRAHAGARRLVRIAHTLFLAP
jgi:hypothetical protein